MKITKHAFQIENGIGKIITGDIRMPDTSEKAPLAIILHGFKGFKDWGFFPYVSEKIAENGIITCCFNFSMNGMEGRSDIVKYPENFAANTVTQEIEDAKVLIKALRNNDPELGININKYWDGELFLIGHSMGAAVSLLIAREDGDIQKLALWGPIAKFDRYSERQKAYWQKTGYLEFENHRTKQILRINVSFLNDFERNKKSFNLPLAMSEIKIPALIVHGKQDLTVPLKEPKALAEEYMKGNPCTSSPLNIIEQTGHTFGIGHPFGGSCAALEKLIDLTNNFLEKK